MVHKILCLRAAAEWTINMYVVETENLIKKYGNFVAVDGLNLSVQAGDIFGLLGPNGAGKSTTINMICGLLAPTKGNVRLFGKKVSETKRSIGFIPQCLALYDNFTAYENLKFFGELYNIRGKQLKNNIDEALEMTGLVESRNKRAKTFSGGMLRRLNIACALIHKPKALIMDEPAVGIDPQSRNHIMSSIRQMNADGISVIYTSHYMEEIEALCNKIAIIDKGKVIAYGTKKELKNLITDKTMLNVTVSDTTPLTYEGLMAINGVESAVIDEYSVSVTSARDADNFNEIIEHILNGGVRIKNVGYQEVSLETVFLSLTGKKLRD